MKPFSPRARNERRRVHYFALRSIKTLLSRVRFSLLVARFSFLRLFLTERSSAVRSFVILGRSSSSAGPRTVAAALVVPKIARNVFLSNVQKRIARRPRFGTRRNYRSCRRVVDNGRDANIFVRADPALEFRPRFLFHIKQTAITNALKTFPSASAYLKNKKTTTKFETYSVRICTRKPSLRSLTHVQIYRTLI